MARKNIFDRLLEELDQEDFLEKRAQEWTRKTADALFRHNIEPAVGSVVYCNMLGFAEHTGIYTGDGDIVHLEGSGAIHIVTPEEFCQRISGLNPAFTIFCPVDSRNRPIGDEAVAERALAWAGEDTEYCLLDRNCHAFTARCLTGREDIFCPGFTMLEKLLRKEYGMARWRATSLNWDE